MKLYLDLDGVLADFNQQLKNFGVTHKNEQYHLPSATWTPEQLRNNSEVGWAMEQKGFWEGIPLMADALELWDYCKVWAPIILTGLPSNQAWHDRITGEKIKWVSNKLSRSVPVIVCMPQEKKQYATKGSVLVDDLQRNITEWNDYDGHGILHTDAFTTIRKLDHAIHEYGRLN